MGGNITINLGTIAGILSLFVVVTSAISYLMVMVKKGQFETIVNTYKAAADASSAAATATTTEVTALKSLMETRKSQHDEEVKMLKSHIKICEDAHAATKEQLAGLVSKVDVMKDLIMPSKNPPEWAEAAVSKSVTASGKQIDELKQFIRDFFDNRSVNTA